jgi:Undecaprenyl-phosphate glucose phosphotransferase
MHNKYNQILSSFIFASDILWIIISWLLSYYIRFSLQLVIPVTKGIPPLTKYIQFLPFVIIVYGLCFRFFKSYTLTKARFGWKEFYRLAHVNSVALFLLASVTFFYRDYSYSRIVMVYFWGLNIILLSFARWGLIKLLPWLRKNNYYNLRRILIVGTGNLGQNLARRIIAHPELGFDLVGFVDDNPQSQTKGILGPIREIQKIIQANAIDQIFIALPLNNHQTIETLMESLGEEVVDIKVVPDFLRFMQLNAGIEDLDGLPIISLRETPMIGWNRFLKRVLDLIISSLAIILFSPLILLIAIIIKLTSRGPVFYRQERCGMDKKPFMMYKFRTMVVDAEQTTGAVWAQKNDSRCTPFGALLRRTSLDELPQFFNVLKGEMSLVGPRPERPVFVDKFKKSVPQYMLRHKMKAGITGWAQVNGWRGNTSLEKRIEYDLYYIEHWSLLFDLKIIWLTLWKGLINKNAY